MKARLFKTLLSVLILFSVSSGVIAGTYQPADKNEEQIKEELSVDGPYILYQPDGSVRVISVNKKLKIEDKT